MSVQVREQYQYVDADHLRAHVGNGFGSCVEVQLAREALLHALQGHRPLQDLRGRLARQLIHQWEDVD